MRRYRVAFTLLELAVTLGTIAILVLLFLPVLAKVRARAQRVQCAGNLRSLHVAAQQYIQDNNQWPQIRTSSSDASGTLYAQKWIAALAPYEIRPKTWICPTVETLRGNPDYTTAGKERIDYYAMTFDDKPMTPHQWPRFPWSSNPTTSTEMANSLSSLTVASLSSNR